MNTDPVMLKATKAEKAAKTEKTVKAEKAATPWALFKERVQTVTGLSRSAARHFATFLRERKGTASWLDAEMAPLIPVWKEAAALEPKKEKKVMTKGSKDSESDDDEEEDPTASTPAAAPAAPVETASALEFHLLEAKKKVASATGIATKADADAAKAGAKAEEAMKVALELKVKSDKAAAEAADARAFLVASQKEADARAAAFAAFEKAATPSPAAAAEASESDPLHVKRKKIPKHIKTLVWNKYMGVDTAQSDCVSCRSVKITNRSFHCGHVIAESKGGDMNINNLRPICDACNGSMATRSMNEFTKEFFGWTV